MRGLIPIALFGSVAVAAPHIRRDQTPNRGLTPLQYSFITVMNQQPADKTFEAQVDSFTPEPPVPPNTDEVTWPYDTPIEEKVRQQGRKLIPVQDPSDGADDVSSLAPMDAVLEYLAEEVNKPIVSADSDDESFVVKREDVVGEDDDGLPDDGERNIAAAILIRAIEGVKIVNLGGTSKISEIECDSTSLKMTFTTADDADRAMRYIPKTPNTAAGDKITYLDAYGKQCGKEGDLQLWSQVGAPVRSGRTIAVSVEVIEDETSVVEEIRLAWGEEYPEAISEALKQKEHFIGRNRLQARREKDALDLKFEGEWPKTGKIPPCGQSLHSHLRKRGVVKGKKEWAEDYTLKKKLSGDKTPWGDGLTLYKDSSVHVACVGCFLDLKVKASGAVEWNVKNLAKGGVVGASGLLSLAGQTVFQIGVDAKMDKTFKSSNFMLDKSLKALAAEVKKNIDYPLSPFSLANFFIIGPSLGLEPFGKVNLKSTGQFLMGAKAEINKKLNVNLKDEKAVTTSGTNLKITPLMKLNADVQSELVTGVRLRFDLGVVVMNKKHGISWIVEPYFFSHARITADKTKATTKSLSLSGLWPLSKPPSFANVDRAPLVSVAARELSSAAGTCDGVSFDCGLGSRMYFQMNMWKAKEYEMMREDLTKSDYCWTQAEIQAFVQKIGPQCLSTDDKCINYTKLKSLGSSMKDFFN